MIKSLISRTYLPSETKGSFFVMDGDELLYKCKTLELPDNSNQKNTSCIPEGTYKMKKIIRPNGNPTFLLLDVPDRDNIEIHVGNFKKDTSGCILPGLYFTDINGDGLVDVAESGKAMKKLLSFIPDESILIII